MEERGDGRGLYGIFWKAINIFAIIALFIGIIYNNWK